MSIFPSRVWLGVAAQLLCWALVPATAIAQTAPASTGNEIVVTGNPLGSGLFELANPASQLSGSNLDFRRASSLGETLSNEPGISSTYFGPNSSRPIIRGLDGDRIRLLQNGATLTDASSLSFDHAAATDPLVAERIEVVRGPAALLYGGSAIGGVVNTLDNRIPTAPITQTHGRAEFRAGSADRERSGAVVLESGNGQIAVHADAYQRNHRDVKIPGFARSAAQRALDAPDQEQPSGRLPNTFNQGEGGALGASMTWNSGYAGLSFGSLRSNYGTPAEESVRIDMRKDTIGFAGEWRKLAGPIEAVKFQVQHSDYQHDEKERGTNTINTTFKNRGYDTRVELKHQPVAGFNGVIGAQLASSDFSALGDEAFVPTNRQNSRAIFIFEEYRHNKFRLNFGLRNEQARLGSRPNEATLAEQRFGAPVSRNFNAQSFSLGGLYSFDPQWSLAANGALTERTPTAYELFANGPHAATGTFEVGNPNFGKERSVAFDLALRHQSGPNRFTLGVFQKRFSNFILLAPTGRLRAEDGSLEDPATPGTSTSGEAASLPEYEYREVPALLRGAEIGGRWRALSQGGTLDVDAKVDWVRATQTQTGEPLPRIAPMRVSFGAIYQTGPWYARAELAHSAAQNRIANNETATAGYTLLNAMLSLRLRGDGQSWEVFLRGNNLTNVEARNHASLLKDVAPLPGRAVVLGARTTF